MTELEKIEIKKEILEDLLECANFSFSSMDEFIDVKKVKDKVENYDWANITRKGKK